MGNQIFKPPLTKGKRGRKPFLENPGLRKKFGEKLAPKRGARGEEGGFIILGKNFPHGKGPFKKPPFWEKWCMGGKPPKKFSPQRWGILHKAGGNSIGEK